MNKKEKAKEQLNYCLVENKTRASLITLCAAAAELHIQLFSTSSSEFLSNIK